MSDKKSIRKNTKPMICIIDRHGNMQKIPDCRKSKERYVEQANEIWHGKYDYTESNYTGNKDPIIIYCPKHDYHFRVPMAQNHILKPTEKFKPTGCPICRAETTHNSEYGTDWRKHLFVCEKNNRVGKIGNSRLSQEEKDKRKFAAEAAKQERQRIKNEEQARKRQEREADQQRKREERQRKLEADKAIKAQLRKQKEKQRIKELQQMFLREAPKAQGREYQYRGVEMITTKDCHVDVHCGNPDHQWHPMLVHLILQGCKCRECAGRHQPKNQRCKDWIDKSVEKYRGQYDYSRVLKNYKNNDSKVCVGCKVCGTWFQITPDTHLRGVNGGCPTCYADLQESEGERSVRLWLEDHNINYSRDRNIPNEDPTLPLQYLIPDFYIETPEGQADVIIEYNGELHYIDVPHFYKDRRRNFSVQQHRDRYLRIYCENKHIILLEIPYTQFDSISDILETFFTQLSII